MFDPINLSAYADPILDELVSGPPKIDGSLFFDIVRQTEGSILELGCGYGRFTIPLAQKGITGLTGLELSAPSLAYAGQKAQDLPIRWIEADVRNFDTGTQYDLIFARGCVFDFMLTRVDQEAMLNRVHEHLTTDGHFMFDIASLPPKNMVNALEEIEWFTLTHPNGRQIYISGTDKFNYAHQLWTQTCYERWDKPDGEFVRPPWELTNRYTMPQEMETLLHYNGFKVVTKYTDYDGSLETEEKPARVYVCQKQ